LKKTHPGPKRRQTRRLGPFCLRRPALAFVGRHWLLWAFMDLRWLLWAFVGHRWLLWAFVGLHWLLWAFVGLRWPSVAVVGCYGPLLSIKWINFFFFKTHLGPNDARRVVWALFRLCGPSLAVIGYSMAAVGLRGPALAFVGRRWLPWAFVGLRLPS